MSWECCQEAQGLLDKQSWQRSLCMASATKTRHNPLPSIIAPFELHARWLWLSRRATSQRVPTATGPRTAPTINLGNRPRIAAVPWLAKLEPRRYDLYCSWRDLHQLNRDRGQYRGHARLGWGVFVYTMLYMVTVIATRHNPAIRAFYTRPCQRGKPKEVALATITRKLLLILSTAIRDQVSRQVDSLSTEIEA